MREMVISEDYRHMTIRALALHAQRSGKVFASPSTQARLARERGWLRPGRRAAQTSQGGASGRAVLLAGATSCVEYNPSPL
jgi:hypothetical protein